MNTVGDSRLSDSLTDGHASTFSRTIMTATSLVHGSAMTSASQQAYNNATMTPEEESWREVQNAHFSHWLFISLAAVAVVLFLYRMYIIAGTHIRHVVSISDPDQRYWSKPLTPFFANLKKNFIYAPLLRKRHNEEFRITAAGNVGTLPTRFQTLFLAGLLAGNITLSVFSIQWHRETTIVLSQIRNRTGILSVVNMVPLFVLAGRNNPLIGLLKISFDSYNMIHRWLGRIVILEAVAHSVAHIASTVIKKGWVGVDMALHKSVFILVGFISTCAMVAILLQSPSIFRHAFYETFLGIHIGLAIVAVVTLYYHLYIIDANWLLYLQIAIAIWASERFIRFANILYRNCGRKMTKATITTMAADAVRISLDMPRPWQFKPGQHIYLYVPGISLWQSHPFSVAWSEEIEEKRWTEKSELPLAAISMGPKRTVMELIIRRRTGATNKLWRKADAQTDKTITVRAFVEGPYGGIENLESYGTVMMFAAGIGITHHLPHVRNLLQGYADGTVSTRKVILVWVLQNPEHLQWVKRQMTKILAMERRREILKVVLFITRPKQSKEIVSPSTTVQMYPGHPNIEELVNLEIASRVGSMAVTVCGPGSFSDDVRKAARDNIHRANVDFIEEAFSW